MYSISIDYLLTSFWWHRYLLGTATATTIKCPHHLILDFYTCRIAVIHRLLITGFVNHLGRDNDKALHGEG